MRTVNVSHSKPMAGVKFKRHRLFLRVVTMRWSLYSAGFRMREVLPVVSSTPSRLRP
jgi:hypothetical protein